MYFKNILLIICAFLALAGCSDTKLANEILDAYWDQRKACIQNYSKFPFTMDERYFPEFSPLLDELQKYGYLVYEDKKVNINHAPDGKDIWLNARAYSLTDKGKVLNSQNSKLCYGEFETVDIRDVSNEMTHNGVERKVITFDFQLADTEDWATENKELIYLSDTIFDDLSTLQTPATGKMRIRRKPGGEWRKEKIELYLMPPSKDPANERNIILRERLAEADYQTLLKHETGSTPDETLLSYYDIYRHKYMSGTHYEEIEKKYWALSSKILDAQDAKKKSDTATFQKLAQDFALAIDEKDVEKIASLTVTGTAASKAHKNNAFQRNKAGELTLKSFEFSGPNNELVQLQLTGNIYMLRAKLVGGFWAINSYATKSGL